MRLGGYQAIRKLIALAFFVYISFVSSTYGQTCGLARKVVILGSSTASGSLASDYAHSWAGLYASYLQGQNPSSTVINLAVGGYTTYQVLPTGTVNPGNRPPVDTSHNITYALAQNPDAIIVNLPTNDAANMYALSETETNLQALVAAANTAHVPIWISTSQPRNNLIQSQYDALTGLRNWVLATYGTHGLDFWTTVANPDGTIKTAYNGDGTHFNDAGHKILYQRVVTSNLLTSICATTSITGEH